MKKSSKRLKEKKSGRNKEEMIELKLNFQMNKTIVRNCRGNGCYTISLGNCISNVKNTSVKRNSQLENFSLLNR